MRVGHREHVVTIVGVEAPSYWADLVGFLGSPDDAGPSLMTIIVESRPCSWTGPAAREVLVDCGLNLRGWVDRTWPFTTWAGIREPVTAPWDVQLTDGSHLHWEPLSSALRVCPAQPGGGDLYAWQAARAVVTASACQGGHAIAHGAVVAVDGSAVLLAGAKGAGKTSFLLTLLSAGDPHIAFVSNDKSLMRGGDVTGLPFALTLTPDTITRFPAVSAAARGRTAGGKHLAWMSELMDVPRLTSAPLAGVAAVRISPQIECEAASFAAAAAAVASTAEVSLAMLPPFPAAAVGLGPPRLLGVPAATPVLELSAFPPASPVAVVDALRSALSRPTASDTPDADATRTLQES